jgi:peptidoglycan/LPS O-acetylase OafA/YrhL
MSDKRTLGRIAGLDGIRCVAIGLVLLLHNFGIPGGWVGVDLFFVLSGYLITGILLKSAGRDHYFKVFYIRRFLRIFPPYYVLIILLAVADPRVRKVAWFYALYLADFTGLAPQFDVLPLLHTWSLSVEEQFYLVWPVVVLLAGRSQLVVVSVLGILFANGVRVLALWHGLPTPFITFNIFTRCDTLFFGALLACFANPRKPSDNQKRLAWGVAGCTALVIAVLVTRGEFSVSTHPSYSMYTAGYFAVAVGSASLIWLTASQSLPRLLMGILCWKPVEFVGRISYGIYLFHQPILAASGFQPARLPIGERVVYGGLLALAALIAAALSWRFLEAPIGRLKDRFA